MSDSESTDLEEKFEHIANCPRCLREMWEEHIPLELENKKLKAELQAAYQVINNFSKSSV